MNENKPYTPTDEQVRTTFVEGASEDHYAMSWHEPFADAYDRWLAAHDAQVAREAVLRIAGDFQSDAEDAQESEDFDYAYEMARHALNIRQTANLRYPEEPTDA